MDENGRHEIRLYCDCSEESKALERDLREKGYDVRTIVDGCLEPTLDHPGGFLTGTLTIRRHFLNHSR